MEWTQEGVIEFIELYKRKEIRGPKHPKNFNKMKMMKSSGREKGEYF
jgi:hypothetical protein